MADKTPLLRGRSASSKSTWELFVEDILWSRDESHIMIVSVVASDAYAALPLEEQLRSPWALYNPLYLVLLCALMVCVLSGRWVHALFGQGGPVRPDELIVEREARIQWIYTTDGPFAVTAFINLLSIGWYAAIHELAGNWLDPTFDLVVAGAYILGNCFFLEALSKKDVLEIRVAIVANATFTLGLLVLLFYGYVQAGGFTNMPDSKEATWFIRALTVLFFVAATAIYTQLWNAHGPIPYSDDDDPATPEWKTSRPLHYLILCLAALAVWLLIGLTIALEGPHAILSAVR